MHTTIRNGILCFAMLSVVSVHNVISQESATSTSIGTLPLKMGIGLQGGIRFHQPEAFNDFITDVYNTCLEKNVYGPIAKKNIGPGLFLGLNGTFDIGPFFQVTPFVQGMWAGKWFSFSGDLVMDANINTYTALGGLNLWFRAIDREVATLRVGAGSYGTHTIASTNGDLPHKRFSGSGFGFKVLLGTEVRLNSDFVLTFDCGVPFGKSEFNDDGNIKIFGTPVSYPDKFEHSGFELSPGIVYYF